MNGFLTSQDSFGRGIDSLKDRCQSLLIANVINLTNKSFCIQNMAHYIYELFSSEYFLTNLIFRWVFFNFCRTGRTDGVD